MPKMKTSRTLAKRIRLTSSGKIKVHHSGMGHFAKNKTHKQKKHLAKAYYVDSASAKKIDGMINHKMK